ncbi:MAG: peptidoglycan-associated lipoprotein Pal [Deltaproteobacteria bacterium]
MKNIAFKFLFVSFALTVAAAGCSTANKAFKGGDLTLIGKEAGVDQDAGGVQHDGEMVPDDNIVAEDASRNTSGVSSKTNAEPGPLTQGGGLAKKAADSGSLYAVYFDYDQYTIKDEDFERLATNAKWLKSNAGIRIVVEGHADERGETEYNLALGDRRARSVKRFLEDFGVHDERIATITFGEEKPADLSHNEDAWSRNRRAEFMLLN